MIRRRSVDEVSEHLSSPRKRPRYSFPQTPAASGSFASSSKLAASSSSSPGKFLETPRTPYTPYPLRASDSPSNPFGRKRKARLLQTLPEVTGFKRHIPLRFQFVRKDINARQGGVFRVVRVPTNYTFAHLRCLIAWLFDTPAHYANGKNGLGDAEDYLFEVKSKAKMYSPLYKPGQLKGGVTTVKLSNVRDPARWRSGYGNGAEEDELSESEDEEMVDGESQADGEEVDFTWVDEEDYTLAHAWRSGLDPTTGIIYHHSHSTQVHITVNNLVKVPILKGSSNTPEVLTARGRVHLSTPPLPRPKFTRSILDTFSPAKPKALPTGRSVRLKSPTPPPRFAPRSKAKLKSPPPKNLSDIDAEGDTDEEKDNLHEFDSTHPFFNPIGSPAKKHNNTPPEVILVEDSDEEDAEDAYEVDEEGDPLGEDTDKVLGVERWNTPKYAFALYLLRFMDPLGGPYDDIDASFFEKEKVYDPFENDNDPIVEPKRRRVEEAYEEDIGDEEEEEEEEEDEGEEQQEEEDEEEDIDDHEDADEEDVDLQYDEDEEEEEEINEDSDSYEDSEIQTNPTTQKNPSLTSEYTPDLTNGASPSSSLPPSSPGPGLGILSSPSLYSNSFANSSSHSLFDGSAYSDSIIILEEHYPNKKYTFTPAPPKKRKHRLRIKRLEKKLANIKKSAFLCRNDEKPAKEEEVEEVDELAEESSGAGEKGVMKPKLKDGSVWDPFGDEPEI